jgi:hypothetical protein
MKHELQNIISGKGKVKFGRAIQTITSYLERGYRTGKLVKEEKHFKNKEKTHLIEYANKNNLWVKDIDFSKFVSEGAEQRVFLKSGKKVQKLNDSIYYTSWIDYFHNLLLNNYFFEDTAYNFNGFFLNEDILYAVVDQSYIKANQKTNLDNVKLFLESNGFANTKNNDYKNETLGIILEDLHDENVLTKNGILYFIDTVFYLTENF